MIQIFFLLISLFGFCRFSYSEVKNDRAIEKILDKKLHVKDFKKEGNKHTFKQKKINFSYDGVELVKVINNLAREKNVNVILPTGVTAIKNKITLHLDHKITVKNAWRLLYTILDTVGYSLIKKDIKGLESYKIIKNDQHIAREALPLYVGVKPEDLPATDKRIRYLYYFNNLTVPTKQTMRQSEIFGVLTAILPKNTSFQFIPISNGMLLVDKSSTIKAAMKLVLELDKAGFKEQYDTLKLHYTKAGTIADLFNKSILAISSKDQNRYRLGLRKSSEMNYFSKNIKIIADGRTNTLILVGDAQAIARTKEFIRNYIDIRLESGNSILHTYQLQYLDAQPFAQVLKKIVASSSGKKAQSKAGSAGAGPEKFFEGVIIATDTPAPSKDKTAKVVHGSNQLIIAAKGDDWIRIKKLIEQLDRPQSQVIIEVLIADLTISDERLLGSITRAPASIPLPNIAEGGAAQFQAAHLGNVVGETNNNITSNLHVDLAKSGGTVDSLAAIGAQAGGGIVTLSDKNGDVWSILQVLKAYDNAKILSHPHIIATNNEESLVKIGETRRLPAEATSGQGGVAVSQLEDKSADLEVKIRPRLSAGGSVHLTVSVKFNEFKADGITRIDREVETNAYVKTGNILALGGLIKVDTSQGVNKTPILANIPILGWFFKKRTGLLEKNNLTVFIRPTIIQPRLRRGIDEYTKGYIRVAKDYAKEGMLFDGLQEPVTRWFFRSGLDDAQTQIDTFIEDNERSGNLLEDFADNTKLAALEKEKSSDALPKKVNQQDEPLKKGQYKVLEQDDRAEKIKLLLEGKKITPVHKHIDISAPVSKKNSSAKEKNVSSKKEATSNKSLVNRGQKIKSIFNAMENPLVS